MTNILKRYRSAAGLNDPLFPSHSLLPEVDIVPLPSEELTRVLNLLTACRTGKLGSHVFDCDGCQRSLVGLNRCTNRHCPACSHGRREAWQTSVSQWAPRCSYWHIVFTLPHDLNPLLKANEAVLFRLFGTCCSQVLERIATRELHCQPGMISALHTWGQRMNYHVHQHIILTAGGLSLDGERWIELMHDHPALRAQALADQLRTTFVRRLRSRLKQGKLVWPADEIGMSQEAFFEGLSGKPWMARSQPPSLETDQASNRVEGIVHYLAAYVSGTAIGNGRILEDDGQTVHFQFKDYRTGKLDVEKLSGVEFTRRFCQHVWPKSIRKVRYGGLFAARGRSGRMELCNQLISQVEIASAENLQPEKAPANSKFAGDIETSDEIEAAPTMSGACCRYCQGQLAVTIVSRACPLSANGLGGCHRRFITCRIRTSNRHAQVRTCPAHIMSSNACGGNVYRAALQKPCRG